jgi:tetratricopeptide (TPR) repeat protein
MRCTRCGHEANEIHNFCCDCGMFLREAQSDQLILLALAQERRGDHRAARRSLEQLTADEPGNALAQRLLGAMYFHQGTMDLAIERYQRALEAAPEYVRCAYDLGVAWYHRGNMLEAARAFRRCLEIDPHYNAAHYRLALALFHAGRLSEALEHFENCRTLTPEYLMARYHVGVIHERRGDLEKAAAAFEGAIDDSIGEVGTLYHLARVRELQGEDAEAKTLLRRAREFGDAAKN